MVQKQEIDQTIIAAHNRNMGNICHAYANRRGDRDQAVYVSMIYYACLASVTLNQRCIKINVRIIFAIAIFLMI